MMMRWMGWIGVASTVALVAACGGGETDGSTGDPGPGSGGGTSDGGAGGTTSASGASGPGVGGFMSSGGNSGVGGMEGCLTSEAEAKESPLDIVVLLDRSGSMAGTLWDGSVNALTTFFNNPGGQNISAAINYFPPSGTAAQCQPQSYNPPSVPIADLAVDANLLVTSMQNETPAGDETPTWAGLFGTLQYANDLQDQNPDHVVVVVLASDGDPTACNTNIGDIGDLAATALAYNGVRTFVVAIQGATLANLDQIAAAGGTQQAFDVTNDVSQFAQKMEEIRAEVVECEFIIPEPMQGEEFDPQKLNITYDAGTMGNPQDIPQVASLEDCAGGEGWYYDNPGAPTKALLCPATCDLVQADTMAKVSFVFGCPTVVK